MLQVKAIVALEYSELIGLWEDHTKYITDAHPFYESNLEDFLESIHHIFRYITSESDLVRLAAVEIEWQSVVTDEYSEEWIDFLVSTPAYAAELASHTIQVLSERRSRPLSWSSPSFCGRCGQRLTLSNDTTESADPPFCKSCDL